MLLMLEDNADRVQRFEAVLAELDPKPEMRLWRSAPVMLREMSEFLPRARLISLDHDLDPEEADPEDPGTGWDVVKVLAALPPVCPVIVHTSNGERGQWMCGELDLGGWEYHRIYPIGDDWIEIDWRRRVRRVFRLGRRKSS